MGIEVKAYKLGGSIEADVYIQLGRQPVCVQRKLIPQENQSAKIEWELIYVAVCHATKSDDQHLTVVRQGGMSAQAPITSTYAAAYADLKKFLDSEGYEYTDDE